MRRAFLGIYTSKGILASDPFVSIDRDGVGELVRIAAERGRKVRKDLKLGICGEHGGDPASVAFCNEVGLDYVSCSPFRVPIARLAAAQAALGKSASSTALTRPFRKPRSGYPESDNHSPSRTSTDGGYRFRARGHEPAPGMTIKPPHP